MDLLLVVVGGCGGWRTLTGRPTGLGLSATNQALLTGQSPWLASLPTGSSHLINLAQFEFPSQIN